MKKAIIAIALLTLSACESSHKGICRTNVKSKLLNPETAALFDFHEIGSVEYRDKFISGLLSAKGSSPDDASPADRLSAERLADVTVSGSGSKYYDVRVRAESKTGVKITTRQICLASSDEQCMCAAYE